LLKQRLVSGLAALHRREAGDPQFDDVGFAVEVFHQLAKGELGQRSVILLGDGDARDLAVNRSIEHGNFNPGVHRFFHQRGRVRIASLGENNAVVFLANRLVNEVLEFGVIAVAQEGADFKTELFTLLDRPGDKLGGVIVGSRLRITAIRIGPLCSAIAAGIGVGVSAKAAAELNNPNAMSESVIFFMVFTL
jgi:hypothetical protein